MSIAVIILVVILVILFFVHREPIILAAAGMVCIYALTRGDSDVAIFGGFAAAAMGGIIGGVTNKTRSIQEISQIIIRIFGLNNVLILSKLRQAGAIFKTSNINNAPPIAGLINGLSEIITGTTGNYNISAIVKEVLYDPNFDQIWYEPLKYIMETVDFHVALLLIHIDTPGDVPDVNLIHDANIRQVYIDEGFDEMFQAFDNITDVQTKMKTFVNTQLLMELINSSDSSISMPVMPYKYYSKLLPKVLETIDNKSTAAIPSDSEIDKWRRDMANNSPVLPREYISTVLRTMGNTVSWKMNNTVANPYGARGSPLTITTRMNNSALINAKALIEEYFNVSAYEIPTFIVKEVETVWNRNIDLVEKNPSLTSIIDWNTISGIESASTPTSAPALTPTPTSVSASLASSSQSSVDLLVQYQTYLQSLNSMWQKYCMVNSILSANGVIASILDRYPQEKITVNEIIYARVLPNIDIIMSSPTPIIDLSEISDVLCYDEIVNHINTLKGSCLLIPGINIPTAIAPGSKLDELSNNQTLLSGQSLEQYIDIKDLVYRYEKLIDEMTQIQLFDKIPDQVNAIFNLLSVVSDIATTNVDISALKSSEDLKITAARNTLISGAIGLYNNTIIPTLQHIKNIKSRKFKITLDGRDESLIGNNSPVDGWQLNNLSDDTDYAMIKSRIQSTRTSINTARTSADHVLGNWERLFNYHTYIAKYNTVVQPWRDSLDKLYDINIGELAPIALATFSSIDNDLDKLNTLFPVGVKPIDIALYGRINTQLTNLRANPNIAGSLPSLPDMPDDLQYVNIQDFNNKLVEIQRDINELVVQYTRKFNQLRNEVETIFNNYHPVNPADPFPPSYNALVTTLAATRGSTDLTHFDTLRAAYETFINTQIPADNTAEGNRIEALIIRMRADEYAQNTFYTWYAEIEQVRKYNINLGMNYYLRNKNIDLLEQELQKYMKGHICATCYGPNGPPGR